MELDSVKLSQQLSAPLCFQDLKTAREASASREEKRLRRGRGNFLHALVFLVLSEHESLGRAMQGWDPALTAPLSGNPTVGLGNFYPEQDDVFPAQLGWEMCGGSLSSLEQR